MDVAKLTIFKTFAVSHPELLDYIAAYDCSSSVDKYEYVAFSLGITASRHPICGVAVAARGTFHHEYGNRFWKV